MKKTALCFAVALAVAVPAHAQFGAIGRIKENVNRVRKVADLNISDKEERAIGEVVSKNVVEELGVYQDEAVTKYVTLVGMSLAQHSQKPNLDWQFIVLDTDGVNAYAAPGGFIHITRGALALIKSEAELAGVLAHEIVHITAGHSITAIKRSKGLEFASEEFSTQGGLLASAIGKMAEVGTEVLLFNKFDRGQEMESDKEGLQIANKAGYSPTGLTEFLNHLTARNKERAEPNGLFATHPQLKERIEENTKTAKDKKLTAAAMVEARYASSIKVEASPMASISMVPRGVRGAAAADSTQASNKDAKNDDAAAKKKKGGFGGLASTLSSGKQAESTQAAASAGGRMIGPDTNAPGGPNKNPVKVTITAADLAEFKKGIV
jgi:predicted Zn-dependent protease